MIQVRGRGENEKKRCCNGKGKVELNGVGGVGKKKSAPGLGPWSSGRTHDHCLSMQLRLKLGPQGKVRWAVLSKVSPISVQS